jgi:hypothetical protein
MTILLELQLLSKLLWLSSSTNTKNKIINFFIIVNSIVYAFGRVIGSLFRVHNKIRISSKHMFSSETRHTTFHNAVTALPFKPSFNLFLVFWGGGKGVLCYCLFYSSQCLFFIVCLFVFCLMCAFLWTFGVGRKHINLYVRLRAASSVSFCLDLFVSWSSE